MAKIKKADLVHLTSEQIKQFFKVEDPSLLPSPIKEFVLAGKDQFDMGPRINRVEKLLMEIIIDRFLSDTL